LAFENDVAMKPKKIDRFLVPDRTNPPLNFVQNKKEEKIGKGGKWGKRGKRVDPCLYNHHPHLDMSTSIT
jgi:hypothetical protein